MKFVILRSRLAGAARRKSKGERAIARRFGARFPRVENPAAARPTAAPVRGRSPFPQGGGARGFPPAASGLEGRVIPCT